jgi:hypothetical protein
VFLANKLPQRARSHTCRQRFGRREQLHRGTPFSHRRPRLVTCGWEENGL